ncbi:MAG TPA: HEAT repeat domain-containing protein [Thermodesulfovibrionales bacterium]|nr:HEAT repeat domain-containing protein [Thermodesulfovibrionales bacterium]
MKQKISCKYAAPKNTWQRFAVFLLLSLILLTSAASASSVENRFVSLLGTEGVQVRPLSDSDREVLKSVETLEALIAYIRKSIHDWRLQIRGIRILGQTGSALAAEALREMFYDPIFNYGCPSLKLNLVIALGNFPGNKRVSETLISGAQDFEIQVKEASILSLGKNRDREAVSFLLEKLTDQSFTIRLAAISSLGEIGDRRAAAPLRKIEEHDQDSLIRTAARTALGKIN